ncbi:hypothetical protein [Teredinibacter turnerae]|uniref:hypothetical protein n=1 Tax=Teredinibacter turnerae TaxID=2426 RepID=UPI000364F4F9|nr:hypothetical protein [Teredinibacter turnerae]
MTIVRIFFITAALLFVSSCKENTADSQPEAIPTAPTIPPSSEPTEIPQDTGDNQTPPADIDQNWQSGAEPDNSSSEHSSADSTDTDAPGVAQYADSDSQWDPSANEQHSGTDSGSSNGAGSAVDSDSTTPN